MAYFRNKFHIDSATFQEMEGLRKSYMHEKMNRAQAQDLLKAMHLPDESPKLWKLLLKYNVLTQHGSRRYAYYMVPLEMYSMKTLKRLESEFYNGKLPKKAKEPTPAPEGYTKLDESFCLNYLKQRGYMCFKLTPNLIKLQRTFTPQFLIESCDAELK